MEDKINLCRKNVCTMLYSISINNKNNYFEVSEFNLTIFNNICFYGNNPRMSNYLQFIQVTLSFMKFQLQKKLCP